jgi:transposase
MADHYCIAVLPARPYHPKDKSKVEVGVQIVERWIVARLRNMTFFSLAGINAQIRILLAELNDKPFKQIPGSRSSLFSSIEKSVLAPLPAEAYSVREWKTMKVPPDYHVEVHGHRYSVPYRLRGETVSVAYDAAIVEIFHDNKRIASHARDDRHAKMSTAREHLAPAHAAYAENNYEKLMARALAVGSATHALFSMIATNRQHITQCIGSFRGILRLADKHPSEEIEAACAKALIIRGYTYRSVASILSNNLQRSSIKPRDEIRADHENIRGWQHFALTKETVS